MSALEHLDEAKAALRALECEVSRLTRLCDDAEYASVRFAGKRDTANKRKAFAYGWLQSSLLDCHLRISKRLVRAINALNEAESTVETEESGR